MSILHRHQDITNVYVFRGYVTTNGLGNDNENEGPRSVSCRYLRRN